VAFDLASTLPYYGFDEGEFNGLPTLIWAVDAFIEL